MHELTSGRTLNGLAAGKMFEPIKLKAPGHAPLLQDVRRLTDELSPAALKLLAAVRRALLITPPHDYRSSVTRHQIAYALRGQGGALWRHDIDLLKLLVATGLIRERKRAKAPKQVRGADGQMLRLGAGFELIYSIPERVLYALVLLDNPNAFFQPAKPAVVGTPPGAFMLTERGERQADNSASAAAPIEQLHGGAAPALARRSRHWHGMTRLQVAVLVVLGLALVVMLVLAVVLLRYF